MKLRVIKYVGLAAALVGGAAAAQAAVQPLRLCADPANLPFSSNAPEAVDKGAPGLYVEIGRAVAEALGRPMKTVWSLSYFGKRNIRTTLLAGQCDLAVGLPADADFMGPRVIFTRPILKLGYALVVPKGRVATGIDDLRGKRVAVQFASPPQSLLATRSDIASVTTMDPEEAMRRLAAGAVDAAFIWGPSAGYINHTALHDEFNVIPVEAPQMQWQAAIGFSNKQPALRDEVDAVLGRLEPRIRELTAKYAVATGPLLTLSDAAPMHVAANEAGAAPAQGGAEKGDAAEGKEIFNGTCAHCHGPDAIVADRKINLRVLKHKYGDQMPEVFFTTVTQGRLAKGMPSWKDVFKHQDFVNILAYLNTVQDK
jgi:polar amino acid transport system substrate-binding protein